MSELLSPQLDYKLLEDRDGALVIYVYHSTKQRGIIQQVFIGENYFYCVLSLG